MTPSEFKAWFEGFTEAFSGVPTKVQWARIKERVAEVDGNPITERVFVDRWYPYWQAHFYPYANTTAPLTPSMISYQATNQFDSCVAMNAVGRTEAATLTG